MANISLVPEQRTWYRLLYSGWVWVRLQWVHTSGVLLTTGLGLKQTSEVNWQNSPWHQNLFKSFKRAPEMKSAVFLLTFFEGIHHCSRKHTTTLTCASAELSLVALDSLLWQPSPDKHGMSCTQTHTTSIVFSWKRCSVAGGGPRQIMKPKCTVHFIYPLKAVTQFRLLLYTTSSFTDFLLLFHIKIV